MLYENRCPVAASTLEVMEKECLFVLTVTRWAAAPSRGGGLSFL